jgi:hypothetical protein
MKPAELLSAWSLVARGPASWLAYCAGETDPVALARACSSTLACPIDPTALLDRLLVSGEYDGAELLMQETAFWEGVDAERLHELESKLERGRSAAVEEIQGKLADLQVRAAARGVVLDETEIVQAVRRQRTVGLRALEQEERRVEDAEAAVVQELRASLAESEPGELDEIAHAEWRADVEHAIDLGAIEAARAAIEMGASLDRLPLVGVPSPPVWPYRTEPLRFVVDWMFGEGVMPPGFERYRPREDDSEAWRFLEALREGPSQGNEAMLSGIAGVVETAIVSVEVREDGILGRLENLGAPGFHAFGPCAWQSGIPIWLPSGDASPPSDGVENGIIIEFAVGAGAGTARHVLRLDVHDVLAVLRDRERRRERLLAQLGRQLPLEKAFTDLRADAAARWERSDLPPRLASDDLPTLLVGAPGLGKSTQLLELAATEGEGAALASAAAGGDLPEADLVLVDDADGLGADELRTFVRDVHWARTTRTPPPRILVAIRPEKVPAFEQIAKKVFDVVELPPRSTAALREQARTMLGWVGVEAASPGSYDRLAFLAGGNPTLLFLLCRALTVELSREDRRRFTPHHVESAWEDPELRESVRDLLWAPLQGFEGASDTLQVLVDFCDPGDTLALDDLTWAIEETIGERQPDWIAERLTVLRRYGLVREMDGNYGLRLGGAGVLVRSWLADDSQKG